MLRSQSAFNAAVKALRLYKRVSKRSTGMCDHCMEGQRHHAALDRQLLQHRSTCMFVFTIRQPLLLMQSTSAISPTASTVQAVVESSLCRCELLQLTDVHATLALLPVVCFYLHHRAIKQQVLSEYRRQQASLQPGHVMITMHYKQNIDANVARTRPVECSTISYSEPCSASSTSIQTHVGYTITMSTSSRPLSPTTPRSHWNACSASSSCTLYHTHCTPHTSGVTAAVTSAAANLLLVRPAHCQHCIARIDSRLTCTTSLRSKASLLWIWSLLVVVQVAEAGSSTAADTHHLSAHRRPPTAGCIPLAGLQT